MISDPEGKLSDFTHGVHWTVSRCLLPYYRDYRPDVHLESFWSPDKPSEVLLANHNAILDAIVYDLTNPVRDGLVYSHEQWPGVLLGPRQWTATTPRVVQRPDRFFSADGAAPPSVECRVVPPPQFCDRSTDKLAADVQRLIAAEESSVRATMRAQGRSFMGVKKLLRDDPFDAPRTPRPRSRVLPTVAGGGEPQVFGEALEHVVSFRQACVKA